MDQSEYIQSLLDRIQELERENSALKARLGDTTSSVQTRTVESGIEDNAVELIQMDNLSLLQGLFKSGLDLNAYVPSQGTFLIHEAVKSGSIKVLNFLIMKGANLNATADDGNSPLTLAAQLSKHDAMCILL